MGKAKQIVVKVIKSKDANNFVKKHHYSNKVVPNSNLHFGCFLNNKLHGVLSYGSPFMKTLVLPLVKDTGWSEMLELNRMAFDDFLPRNSESRCIAITIKMIKKNAPHIKWILSYADATQCGDGTIYRASGFLLTQIKKNATIIKLESGEIVAKMTYTKGKNILKQGGRAGIPKGATPLSGYMLRYIYLIDQKAKLNVPILPFSEIEKQNAAMYKGKMR
jgi:hypothetical protein